MSRRKRRYYTINGDDRTLGPAQGVTEGGTMRFGDRGTEDEALEVRDNMIFGNMNPVAGRGPWADEAVCAPWNGGDTDDNDLFFAELVRGKGGWRRMSAAQEDLIERTCQRCPVTEDCVSYARENAFEAGVWGGINFELEKIAYQRERDEAARRAKAGAR